MGQMDSWVLNKRVDPALFSNTLTQLELIGNATGEAMDFYGKKIGGKNGISAREALADINKALRSDSKHGAYWDVNAMNTLGWNITAGTNRATKNNIFTGINSYFEGIAGAQEEWNNFANGLVSLDEQMAKDNISLESLFDSKGILNFEKFQNLINNKNVNDNWKKFANNVEIGGKKLSEVMSSFDIFSEHQSEYSQAIRSLLGMMQDQNWDSSDRLGSLAEMMSKYNFRGEITVGGTTIVNKNGRIVVKGKDGKVVDDQGNEYTGEDAIDQALNDITKRELDDYAKEFKGYEDNGTGRTEQLAFSVGGETYVIEVDGDHYIVKKGKDQATATGANGETLPGTYETVEDAIAATQEDAKLKTEDATKQGMTTGGYNRYIRGGGEDSYGENAKGGINKYGTATEEARSIIKSKNLTADQIAKKANEINQKTDLTAREKSAELMEATGVDVAPTEFAAKGAEAGEKFTAGFFDNVVNQSTELSQTAADVMTGIAAAFSSNNKEVSDSISNTIGEGVSKGIGQAFDESGVDISNLKLNPESLSLDAANVSAETVGDVTVPAGSVTLQPSSVAIDTTGATSTAEKNDLVIEGGIVKYDNNEFKEETPPTQEGGTAKYDNEFKKETPPPLDGGIANYSINIVGNLPTLSGGVAHYSAVVDGGAVGATGNAGLATGNAHAKSTLMGELGPELVVSNNRYFIVGQNGPEFVDLEDDAIVFNHIQTQALLTKGTSC